MRKKSSILSLAALPLFACGGDDGGTKVHVADSKSVDTAPVACKAAASYATVGSGGFGLDIPQTMMGSQTIARQVEVLEPLSMTDALYIELNEGFGGFNGSAIANGTYALSGDDIDYGSCGICVIVWPQSIDGSGHLTAVNSTYLQNEQYIAASGSLTLSMAGAGSGTVIAGSISNVALKHVAIASDRTQTYSPDNCATSITSGNFSVTLQHAGSAAIVGESDSNGFVKAGMTEQGQQMMVRLSNRHF